MQDLISLVLDSTPTLFSPSSDPQSINQQTQIPTNNPHSAGLNIILENKPNIRINMHSTAFFGVLALVASVSGHMEMSFPPPFRSKSNKNADPGKVDYSMTGPITGAAQFPCKGYQVDMGTPGGASVVTWNAGGPANFTIVGGATHGGGSCQASLSYDGGKSFTVIHSFLGNCPTSSGQNFDLTIPSDAKNGAAIFGWTWFNKIGNREIYMNCASVTIAGGKKRDAPAVAFSARPGLFVANIANGCSTVENKDTVFPDPGPDVTGTASGTDSVTGTCAAVNGIGGGSGSSSGGSSGSGSGSASAAPPASSAASAVSSSAQAPASSAPAVSSASSSGFATSVSSAVATSTASASAPIGTGTTGSVSVSTNGQCSGSQTCAGQTAFGSCCSKYGFCGNTPLHCGDGCMPAFGTCGSGGASNSTSKLKARTHLRSRRPRLPEM